MSTITFSKLRSVMVRLHFSALIMRPSRFSTPDSPIRFRHRVIWLGWIGSLC